MTTHGTTDEWKAEFEANADAALSRLFMVVICLLTLSEWGLWPGIAYYFGIAAVCTIVAALWGAWRADVSAGDP